MPGLFDTPTSGENLFTAIGMMDPGFRSEVYQHRAAQATYEALLKELGPEHEGIARAAAMNPREFGALIAPYMDTGPKLIQTQDTWGDPGFYEQRVRGGHINMSPISMGGAAPEGIAGTSTEAGALPGGFKSVADSIEAGRAAGEDTETILKNRVPASLRDTMRAILEGRDVSTKFSMRGKMRDNSIRLAQMLDPSLDPQTIEARKAYQRSYMNPARTALGGNINSLGKVLNHLESATQTALDLNNADAQSTTPGTIEWGDIPGSTAATRAYNAIQNSKGKNAEKVRKLLEENRIYGGELESYLTNGQGTGKEREQYAGALHPNNTRSEFAGAAAGHLGLIEGQTQRLQDEAQQKMGQFAGKYPILSPKMEQQKARILANIEKLKGGGLPARNLPDGWSVEQVK